MPADITSSQDSDTEFGPVAVAVEVRGGDKMAIVIQEILQDKGKVSHAVALALAEKEFAVFRVEQDRRYESDFDRILKQLPKPKPRPKT